MDRRISGRMRAAAAREKAAAWATALQGASSCANTRRSQRTWLCGRGVSTGSWKYRRRWRRLYGREWLGARATKGATLEPHFVSGLPGSNRKRYAVTGYLERVRSTHMSEINPTGSRRRGGKLVDTAFVGRDADNRHSSSLLPRDLVHQR